MTTNSAESRRIAIYVNVAKLTLLAALAPPVVAGIAERATTLGSGFDVTAVVAATASVGSVCAVLGALGLGALADVGRRAARGRWWWVVAGTTLGTAGLVLLSLGTSRTELICGWGAAQLGYSGAMAVLRTILADALPQHRRRGGVMVVLGSYGGLGVPLLVLLMFPGADLGDHLRVSSA